MMSRIGPGVAYTASAIRMCCKVLQRKGLGQANTDGEVCLHCVGAANMVPRCSPLSNWFFNLSILYPAVGLATQ